MNNKRKAMRLPSEMSHPEERPASVRDVAGVLPADMKAEEEHHGHLAEKRQKVRIHKGEAQARQLLEAIRRNSCHFGKITWTRDELYERN